MDEAQTPRHFALIGVPSGLGACGVGQDETPSALRSAGLVDQLRGAGSEVDDLGDSAERPWRPDRANPRAQNLPGVIEMVQETAARVATALRDAPRVALVVGGDCTVGIGSVAGVQQALGDVGFLYFDIHSDLNTPATAGDGALDWMGLGHMLAVPGAEPSLVAAAGRAPMLRREQVVLFAHGRRQATAFERNQIERLGLARHAVEDVADDPQGQARTALDDLTRRFERYVVHLDVDVVDFTDAPISEHTARNTGLPLETMLRALKVLTSGPGLAAITLAELTPRNAAVEEGLLERFAQSLAAAIA
jgi:arginase